MEVRPRKKGREVRKTMLLSDHLWRISALSFGRDGVKENLTFGMDSLSQGGLRNNFSWHQGMRIDASRYLYFDLQYLMTYQDKILIQNISGNIHSFIHGP